MIACIVAPTRPVLTCRDGLQRRQDSAIDIDDSPVDELCGFDSYGQLRYVPVLEGKNTMSCKMSSSGISRRDFLKLTGASAGALGLAGLMGCIPEGQTVYLEEGVLPDTWKKGVCRYCGTGCGMELGVKDSNVVAIRGWSDYPVNKGVLCLKGLSLMYVVHSDQRATDPLIRTGDQFAKASWNKALDTVASKLKQTIDEHGPESVALYLGAQLFTEEFFVAIHFGVRPACSFGCSCLSQFDK